MKSPFYNRTKYESLYNTHNANIAFFFKVSFVDSILLFPLNQSLNIWQALLICDIILSRFPRHIFDLN